MADPDYLLRGSDSSVTSLVFCNDFSSSSKSSFLVSGSLNGTIHIWDLKIRRIIHRLTAHTNSVLSISLPSNGIAYTHGRDGFVYSWKLKGLTSWTKARSWKCCSLGFCPAIFYTHPDKRVLIAAPSEKTSAVDLFTDDCVSTDDLKEDVLLTADNESNKLGMLMDMKCCDTGVNPMPLLLCGYENGTFILWDLSTRLPLLRHREHSEPIVSLDISLPSKRIAATCADRITFAWKIAHLSDKTDISELCKSETKHSDSTGDLKQDSQKNASEIDLNKKTSCSNSLAVKLIGRVEESGGGCVRIRQDGKLILVGNTDGGVGLFGGRKFSTLGVLDLHKKGVQSIAFNNDFSFVVGSQDCLISMWSVYKQPLT